MKMREQLKELETQRRAEVRNLHVTYLRTKRDVRRAVSPDRLIRRHLGASLGVAALVGLILAPRLGGKRKEGKGMGATMGKWFRKLLRKFFPNATGFMPDLDKAQEQDDKAEKMEQEFAEEPRKRGRQRRSMVSQLIAEIAMVLLTRFDVPKLVMQIMNRWRGGGGHEGNGHAAPRVAVADAGAVHEDPFGEMQ